MAGPQAIRSERRAQAREKSRASILSAARRVAARDGARNLSLRGVAAEAGFAPAALYGYFANKDELLLALAADDLAQVSRAMREALANGEANDRFAAASSAALRLLRDNETFAAAAQGALPSAAVGAEAQRLFNGRMIQALKVLSEASGQPGDSRESQCDVVLAASALAGLALLARTGRLKALGFSPEEILARLGRRLAR
ncbi:MAG TPA: TetR family transcriptional regulator [Rhizomicrobium sp.]|jgi:AcrR family transcriptional regulator|nr:TetR family transcriptional regulator [Rhizomicrobium sp.]